MIFPALNFRRKRDIFWLEFWRKFEKRISVETLPMRNWQHNSLYGKYNILKDLDAIQRIIFIIVQAVKVCPWHPSVWQKCCRSKLVYSVSICARRNPAQCTISTPLVRCHYITPNFWGCITLRLWLFSEMFS